MSGEAAEMATQDRTRPSVLFGGYPVFQKDHSRESIHFLGVPFGDKTQALQTNSSARTGPPASGARLAK